MAFDIVPVPEVFTKRLDVINKKTGTFTDWSNTELIRNGRVGISMGGTFFSILFLGIPWYFGVASGLALATLFTGGLWVHWKASNLKKLSSDALDPYEGIPKEVIEWYNAGGAEKNFSAHPYTEWDEMFSRASIKNVKK